MKRQVVQDFLNLPGIVGVALMDGRSRPYFCGVEQILNFQQREAIAQGIQQVVETTPVDLQSFSFQFCRLPGSYLQTQTGTHLNGAGS
ncbi:MAG: hypothetical protein HC886_12455 [Leptolyngbyaceae cyanobacterium SM1_1_3]|nr:hypothetical protein [Leptolyngbyaceae cyanobacterium SM1_1_3]